MRPESSLLQILGRTDIYLIDQILKGRYQKSDLILDAGCGNGRNLQWFIANNIAIFGLDKSSSAIGNLRKLNPQIASGFRIGNLEHMPFPENHFDHIISSAVLHFADGTEHFWDLLGEHVRVLKRGGSLFIRMTSNIGIEQKIKPLGNGVFQIPDESIRFLLTRQMVDQLLERFQMSLEEPLKTTNVSDIRCMSTLVLVKN